MSDAPTPRRGVFASQLGFILAAAGSAVGLGNIWKFPYIAGEYGGGAFVLVYLGCILVVGLPLMYAELIIGKRGGKDVLGAMVDLTRESGIRGKVISWATGSMAVAAGFLILSFYSVVAGWALHFVLVGAKVIAMPNGSAAEAFGQVAGNFWLSAGWHTLFMLITIAVVARGIQGGIERACKVLMPLMLLILVGLLIYVAFTCGLSASLGFLFEPDFGKLTPDAVLEALGHAFFTLSLGMGAMVTYGSYLKSENHVVRDGIAIAILDTVIALLAGTVIFAVVFAAGKEPAAGVGLVFKTLPELFATMPGSILVGSLFFCLLVFAAWSSAISLIEVVVAFCVDELNIARKKAAWIVGAGIWALGLACAKWGSVLDFLDNLTTRYMLPLGGLFIALAAGWLVTREVRESGFATLGAAGRILSVAWTVTIRFVTPALVLVVIVWKVNPELLNSLFAKIGSLGG